MSSRDNATQLQFDFMGEEIKPKLTWQDYPRTKDKLAIVGFATTTRHLAPYDDPEYEIWGLNEEYNYDWMKRYDRWFQIHPRWDYTRPNNMNHRNHWLWLQNKSGKCMRCEGEGSWATEDKGEKQTHTCPECKGSGEYKPPENRANLPIYMQEHWDDIPNSIAYPLDAAKALLPTTLNQKDYFTSSAALMLTLARLMGFKRVEFYGFEMGTMTEYHYQRANFEYLVGLFSWDMEIVVPEISTLMRGELYGFKNMKTGFRQNLEMRKVILEDQVKKAGRKVDIHTGKVQALNQVIQVNGDFKTLLEDVMREYQQLIGQHNVVKGALAEVENMTRLYDNYFLSGSEEGRVLEDGEEVKKYVNLEYN